MYTIAYKWRLSTTKYAYITSTQYKIDGSDPDYTLAQIPATGKLDDATEQIIKDIVRDMTADEYRQCFEYMLGIIANDKDGQYIKLKNWEYYYHFNTNENGDEKVFFVDATASATTSNDGEVHAEVVNDMGTLKFTFQIPQGVNGRDGVDGKDGAPGVPINDGKYIESIYKLTKTNNVPPIKLDDDWDIEGSEYQTNDYIPNGWTDRPSGITSIYKYEWVSTRKYDLVKKLWGEFSEPAIMSRWGEDGKDGDGIEYVYIRTIDEVNPGTPKIPDNWMDMDNEYQTNDEYANFLKVYGWTDEPVGTEKNGYKFEWVSVRKQKDGVWQQFSNPALWSSYGKDGDDVEYIYFLNNDNEVPSFDDYEIDSDDYQSEDFRPKTNGVLWTDNYQSPTYEKRFSWISSRRKRDGKWLDFTGTTLFNVYKISGKAYVDLYTRSNTRNDYQSLPSYDGNIYYSFNSDRFYSDNNLTNEITTVNGLNNTVWYTDIPADNTAKMLFKTSAFIEIKNDFNEIVAIPESSWYGPYLISSNGENATNQTPYINLNDNSLLLPINEENKPHNEYLHSLVGKLLVDVDEAEITEAVIKTSSDKNIKINTQNINKNTNEFHLSFTINKDEEFTNIGIIYITLKGLYEDKEVIANTQYKIIPFYSDNVVSYKMLLNQNNIFVPDNACEILPDGGIWNTQITAHVIDDKGDDVAIGDLLYEYEANKYISFKDNDEPEKIIGTLKLIGCNNEEYIANGYKLIQSLPNPLRLIYKVNGKTLEIGYVDFNNIPKDGKNGISTRTIFAYCSTEESIIPKTPTGGTVDFTTNEVTYPNGVDNNGNAVIWGSSIPLTGVIWLSTCEFSSDTFSGLWSTPVRLTGFKGADGVSAYHLELTNDIDQVYTTDDNVVIKNQKVETIVSILNGNVPMCITADNVTVTSINGFKVSKENVKSDNTNTEVKITFELTGKTLTDKVYYFDISVNGDEYGTTNFDFVKTFKIKNLNGTIDYDLDVSPTFIKIDKNKQYSESAITVNVTERDIATDSKTVTTLTSLTEGLSITYFYNNDSDKQNDLKTLGDKIPVANVDGYNDEINKITINLYKQGEPIDQVFVECVSDGFDGSSYHLELTNEYEQLYVTDNKVVFNQTAETNYTLFNDILDANDDISTITVTIDGGRECKIENYDVNYTGKTTSGITIIPKDKKVNIVFNTGEIINKRDIKVKFSIKTKNGVSIEKILKIIVLNGTKDYDLVVHPTYFKLDKNGKLANSSITVNVSERDITTTNSTIKLLESLPDNIKIKYAIKNYGKQLPSVELDYTNTKVINVTNNIEYVIIELLSGETKLDYIKIETLKDGIDGEDGKTPYHIELTNDMDQILTVDGVVKYPQTAVTTLSLYNGFDKVTSLTKNDITLPSITNFNCEFGAINNGDVEIKIIPIIDKALEIGKNYEFPIKISENKTGLNFDITKIFKCVVLNSSVDYDLSISHGIIKKTNVGYSTNNVNIKIKKTDISRSDRSITYLTNLLNTNLVVDVYKDNDSTPLTGLPYGNNGIDINIATITPETKLVVKLLSGGTLIDVVDIDVVSDGKPGEPGVDGANIEFIYKLFENEADFNSDGTLLPNNSGITGTTKEEILNQLNSKIGKNIPKWTDSPSGINEKYKIEVVSQRNKNAGETVWGEWHTATWAKWGEDGIDGDGVEYIFQITNRGVEPNNPGGDIKSILNGYTDSTLSALTEIVNTFDFFPGEKWFETNKEYVTKLCKDTNVTYDGVKNLFDLNWSDNPSDVGPYEPLEWVSIRRKKVNLDGTFEYIYTDPTIWAEWKRDTYDSLTEFMFTIYDSRVDLSTVKISGGTWENIKDGTVYTGVTTLSGETKLTGITWQDSVPNHNMYTQSVWMVKGFASGKIEYTGDANKSGITYSEIEWTRPTKLIDNQHMQVEYGFEVIDGTGQSVVPKPINLQDIVSGLGLNYDYTTLENAFRENDKASGYDFRWTDNPTGESPTWMITSTFYNGVWSDWVVSKIKGEKGETGETGQSIQIKGSFETLEDLQNAYKYLKNGGTKPSKYFVDDKLIIGDSYIVNESIVNGEKVFGYLYVFVKDDSDFDAAWESVGQIKGDSSYIYIAYASSVTIDNKNIKTYHLTKGGKYENDKDYYGTTPGKYIGIHVATQLYEGHPYPPKLYSVSAITETDNTFLWNKWEGEDGFGQEQIFILSGETAPKVPVYNSKISGVTGITIWNSNDFVPEGWSDVPLTTSDSNNESCCWMATRRFPVKNNAIPNEFVGDTNNKAILFSRYSKDGPIGASGLTPYHVELTNDFDLVSVLNGNVNGTHKISTEVKLYEGNLLRNATAITLHNIANITTGVTTATTNDGCNYYKLDLTVTGNTEFENSRYITVRVNNAYETYLTIKPIESTILYQLVTDKGFVTKGSNSTIIATVKSKTNDGLVSIGNNLPSGMTIDVYKNNVEFLQSSTTTSLTYNYTGGTDFNEIDFRLKLNGNVYDNVNVEVKEKIKKFASLDLTPLDIIVYVDSNNKPLVSSITLNGAFIYEGNTIDLNNNALKISAITEDININSRTKNSLVLKFNNNASINGNTNEYYVLQSEYENEVYENVIHVNYVKGDLVVSALYDTLYIPYDINGLVFSCKFPFYATFNGEDVTNYCEMVSTNVSGTTFNQRAGEWFINLPTFEIMDKGKIIIKFSYNGVSCIEDFFISKKGLDNSFFINAYPQRLVDGNTPIELYITKSSYNGEYVSLNSNDLVLKYKIDNDEEVEYNFDIAPKSHGNIVFYPNGYKNENNYEQEPIYNKIQFNLYKVAESGVALIELIGDGSSLLATEVVERTDITNDYVIKRITASGLEIDPLDIFSDFNESEYDIVIKEL